MGKQPSPDLCFVPASELLRLYKTRKASPLEVMQAVFARIDAVMPEHRHGMNYRPTLDAKGNGHYVAEGFLFHMPGRWQLSFDVERGGRRTRLTSDVLLE